MSVFLNRLFAVCFAIFLPGLFALLNGQEVNNSTPVDFYHPGSAFINPAIINFQDEQLIVGTQALHSGFLKGSSFGLRQDRFQVSFPAVRGWRLGLGLQGSYLNTPIYHQSRLGGLVSFQVIDGFSGGIKFGFINQSFDRSEFRLVDKNDPVFAAGHSVFVPDFGLGFLYEQDEKWRYGLAFDHVNQPDMSLTGAGDKLPLSAISSVLYKHRFFEGTFGLRWKDNRVEPLIEFTSGYQGIGLLRSGFYGGNYTVGGQLYISNKISVDYQFTYALSDLDQFSSGSHRLGLIYRFGKTPQIEYEVRAVFDSLRISERHVQHHFENVLADKEGLVPQQLVEHARFDGAPEKAYYQFVPLDSVPPIPEIDFNAYLVNYRTLVENLVARLHADERLKLRVIVRKKKKRVASALVHHLQTVYGFPRERLEYGYAKKYATGETNGHASSAFALSQSRNKFMVEPRIKRKYNRRVVLSEWRLTIINSRGSVLKEFIGQFDLPPQIRWDWKSNQGKLLPAGNYFYYLEWRDKHGLKQRSAYKKLTISKFKREVNIDVNRIAPMTNNTSHRIDLVLGL